MPKTAAPKSNALFGFFWWFHMWGHSVVDPFWTKVRGISIWNDLEDIVVEMPWYVGIIFWGMPIVFFAILALMGFYAMVFSGFWLVGLVVLGVGKFLGSGWIRYGQKVMHPVLMGMPWYDKQFAIVSRSKRAGLNSFYATGLSKSVAMVYNRAMATVGRKASLIRARIQQSQDNRK